MTISQVIPVISPKNSAPPIRIKNGEMRNQVLTIVTQIITIKKAGRGSIIIFLNTY